MKFLLFLLFFVVFLSSLNFTYSYNANAISPKFPLQTFQDKNEDVNFYSRNDSYLDKSTENQIINLLDIETGAISSNGTHLEIKVFFQDSLNNLIDVLTSKNILLPKEYFMDILIDSDADEDTGFLGYDYRYEIKNNGSVLQQGITDNNNTTITNPETNLTESLQDSGLLTSNELNTVITDTSKSEYLLSQLKWIISGYEIVNYQYILQFFHDNAYPKYLKLIPKGFKITLDLGQLGYPEHYALLINAGIKSDSYQLNDFFTKIHIPKPDIYLNQKLDVKPGFNSIMIPINSTNYFNLNVKVGIDEKDIPENIKVRFPKGNTFNIFDGIGRIPLEVIIDPKSNLTGILLPLKISYNVIGNNDFINADNNNSLTTEYNYSKNTILDLDIERDPQLINWSQIPVQYVAVLIGAMFSFFIPSMARLVKDYRQKRTADNLLKHLMNEKKEVDLKDNNEEDLQKSINKLYNAYRVLRQKLIKGNISKDQYEILKEHLHEILKDLVSKTEK